MISGKTKLINGKLYLFGKSGALLTDGIYTFNISALRYGKADIILQVTQPYFMVMRAFPQRQAF